MPHLQYQLRCGRKTTGDNLPKGVQVERRPADIDGRDFGQVDAGDLLVEPDRDALSLSTGSTSYDRLQLVLNILATAHTPQVVANISMRQAKIITTCTA